MMSELLKGSGDPEQLKSQGWNILAEEVSLPVAVIRQDAIAQNARWMSEFARKNNVLLAPHGKTTMAPELFNLQLEHGAWAITVATVPQLLCAHEAGVKRIILANQLIGTFHFKQVAHLLKSTDIEFYCFVDSIANAQALGKFFDEAEVKLNILLEIGVEAGRCGWRDVTRINEFVGLCQRFSSLQICGLAFYEGVIGGAQAEQKVTQFVETILNTTLQLKQQGVFACEQPIISGAGSAWYDIVAKTLASHSESGSLRLVIRPGCYLIHDTGIYQDAQQTVMARSQIACDIGGDLISSLYLWAYVVSMPEEGLAIVGLGKRDAAFDAGLPQPEWIFNKATQTLRVAEASLKLEKIMDQHAMLRVPQGVSLSVGDMICFSTSHPCLTFDKWRQIGVVEQDWTISKTFTTHF